MLHGISTHLFLPQRLTPSLLDQLHAAGAEAIEVFAARHHFDYTNRGAVRELANWFRANPVKASMHMPIFTVDDEIQWSRHTAAMLNLIDRDKHARIAAMDEVKRALEAAEQVPFQSCVIHLGQRDDEWNTRAIDDSLTAIEHLKAFAGPLGVQLLLENLTNAVATPEHLVEIVKVGHFSTVGFCLDTGHAHLTEGLRETSHEPARTGLDLAFTAFGSAGDGKLCELHLHDNGGWANGTGRDEHCWPGEGTIDWAAVREHTAALKVQPLGMLEISYDLGGDEAKVSGGAAKAWKAVGAEPISD